VQADHIIKKLAFKFTVGGIENNFHCLTGIVWIKDLYTILHMLLNFPCRIVFFFCPQ
jgi:hypothetical protein